MNYLDEKFEAISAAASFPVDQVRYMICLLVAFPLAWIHQSFHGSKALRNLYSLLWGLAFAWICLRGDIIHSFVVATGAYLLVKFGPASASHILVLVFALVYLSCSHIYRQLTDYGGYTLDYTGPQMVLTLKVSSFAYNYYDGQTKGLAVGRLKRVKDERYEKAYRRVIDDQQERSISRLPSLFEYYGFIYFYGGFLAGPAFEIKEYLTFIDMSMFPKRKDGTPDIPSTVLPSLKKLVVGILCVGGVILAGVYPVSRCADPVHIAKSTLLWRLAFIWISVSLSRFKYYVAWTLAEGACVASGLAYNGLDKTGRTRWDRVRNCDILGVELGYNMRDMINNWNMATAVWLKRYVYQRIRPGKKPTLLNTAVTYFVSAFWHGFYPGYYNTFMAGAFCTEDHRMLRRRFRGQVYRDEQQRHPRSPLQILYAVTGWTMAMGILNYVTMSFAVLDYGLSVRAYRSVYFVGHIGIVAVFAFCVALDVLVKPKRSKRADDPHKLSNGSTPTPIPATS